MSSKAPPVRLAGWLLCSLKRLLARSTLPDVKMQPAAPRAGSRDAPAARAGGFSAEAGVSSGFSFDHPPVLVAGTS